MSKPPVIREEDIQKAIVDWLRWSLPKSHRVIAIPNASRRTSSGRASNGVYGLTKGVPDLVIFGSGNAFFVEVKGPKGKLSDAQSEWGSWCATKGGMPWCCARSVEDVRFALSHWGVETREANTSLHLEKTGGRG